MAKTVYWYEDARHVVCMLWMDTLIPLAKSVLKALGLTAAVSATDAANQKQIFVSGHPSDLAPRTVALTISNEEMEDIINVVK